MHPFERMESSSLAAVTNTRGQGLRLVATCDKRNYCGVSVQRTTTTIREMESRPEPAPGSPREFATTRWSLVMAAGKPEGEEAREALSSLCQRYWFPLYAYVRRRVPSLHEAQDLTQEFFVRLLEKNALAKAAPERGRFRNFLLTSLNNFLANEWDRASAQKRGGGCQTLPLDLNM